MKKQPNGSTPVQRASARDRAYTNPDKTDSIAMMFAEAHRAAGMKPAQRVRLAEFNERNRRGEWHV